MNSSRSGRRSLKNYEFTNLLFMALIVAAIFVIAGVVFNYYKTKDDVPVSQGESGVISDSVDAGRDVGMFYLDTKISETSHQYHSRLEVPVTDDGFLKQLFDLPGVEEITLNQTTILIKKNGSTRWEQIQPGVRRIGKEHLHLHY